MSFVVRNGDAYLGPSLRGCVYTLREAVRFDTKKAAAEHLTVEGREAIEIIGYVLKRSDGKYADGRREWHNRAAAFVFHDSPPGCGRSRAKAHADTFGAENLKVITRLRRVKS